MPGTCEAKSLSRVQLFVTPWTVAYQAPLSMGFSRQGYWSGVPFPMSSRKCWSQVRACMRACVCARVCVYFLLYSGIWIETSQGSPRRMQLGNEMAELNYINVIWQ